MSSDETFPYPDPTITFLGGPLDGKETEPLPTEGGLTWPDFIMVPGHDYTSYWLIEDGDHLPEWVVTLPNMDDFDKVYLWGHYWYRPNDEDNGGSGVPLQPEPVSM